MGRQIASMDSNKVSMRKQLAAKRKRDDDVPKGAAKGVSSKDKRKASKKAGVTTLALAKSSTGFRDSSGKQQVRYHNDQDEAVVPAGEPDSERSNCNALAPA